MVVEPSAEMRDNYVRSLFRGLNFSFIAWFYVFQIVSNRKWEVHFILLYILIDSTRKSDIRIWVNKDFEIYEGWEISRYLRAHENVRPFYNKQFCWLKLDYLLFAVRTLIADSHRISN